MGKIKTLGIVLGSVAVTALAIAGINREVRSARNAEQARRNLPSEVVLTRGYDSAWDMYRGVTSGLLDEETPSFDEFCSTACDMNGIDYFTLSREFDGNLKRLELPNYDGKNNNR
jgi:hypothetical protein